MPSSATSPQTAGQKRAYPADEPLVPPQPQDVAGAASSTNSPPLTSAASATSAFRNVSACNRCRIRKNRCDQRLPVCSACEKANVRCVGYDPITKREIPRSYVYYLETRLAYFEQQLKAHAIPYNAAEVYNAESKELSDPIQSPGSAKSSWIGPQSPSNGSPRPIKNEDWDKKQEDADKLNKLVSNIGMVSVQGASDARYLGSTSGISFARVVLAAVKSSVSCNNSERAGVRPSRPLPNIASSGGSSMRDSYFGLQTKPTIKEAPFPDRPLGEKLVNLYFEHANPQIPILHRGEFMDLFDRTYSIDPSKRTCRELYLLNIVFAIGAGIIWGSSDPQPNSQPSDYAHKRARLAMQQAQPEEYHASAIVNLGSFLAASSSMEAAERPNGDLEELQAVLLLCSFALLRPVAPGLWYIVGVAMRLAVDLGLHYEDGTGIDDNIEGHQGPATTMEMKPPGQVDAKEKGRREWIRDLRRRLWWCTYTFDRLVSTCVGRPFGITDQVVTTEFPSLLDDKYITRAGFLQPASPDEPTYKWVSHHYFRLRLLQSEILQVLQHQQARQARLNGTNRRNQFMHTKLPSPFLIKFDSFRSWRRDIDQRLYEWKESAPEPSETGVSFSVQFLELNYWQAVIMLYRQSLSVPAPLANEFSPTEDVSSPSSIRLEEKEDEDLVFLKCAEAGQKTLKLYRQLHRLRLVNYTYLATHHLFMAGISFLYAVWHSPAVRARLTLDDFDFTVLAATSVLGDLMEKCPPAEACRDAFERMSKATVQMCMSTPGFGFSMERRAEYQPRQHLARQSSMQSQSGQPQTQPIPMQIDSYPPATTSTTTRIAPKPMPKRPPPKFDMDLRELFPDDLEPSSRPSYSFPQPLHGLQQQQQRSPQGSMAMGLPPLQQHPQHSPRQQQMSPASSINSQINNGLGMGTSNNPLLFNQTSAQQQTQTQQQQQTPFYMQNTYNPDFMSSLPGMDFLSTTITGGGEGEFNLDVGGGLDLGFGMTGLDFQHDWSDGQGQYDLFEGFFFGNGYGGNGFGGGNGSSGGAAGGAAGS
ncbi:uncharacterized protein A1O5_09172 [Cladophialophora psammophila CBS 110553]|uniref:Zn(2)-C6 fungal-type domain-containing protein n=1 Tax=Cladophialophora psammophila CBS 110553 TaxID=1182543 RepID=W9WT43_9EURO|nr:uncharacterized protein A1O5_09172 [Cladophialophora psammophila CBS 110553]EXJ67826.1 hypothetical protein A1O5_09172 [Cladophialophora psammophila CBS 110553]